MSSRDEFVVNPFAAPDSDLVADQSLESVEGFVYASFWKRFAALFVDFVIFYFINVVIGIIFSISMIWIQRHPRDYDLPMGLLIHVILWLYFALQESSESGATPGKKLMGIRVVDLSGMQVSFLRATGRYFGKAISCLILLIGFLMQPFTRNRQTLHDLMAGTLIIQDESF